MKLIIALPITLLMVYRAWSRASLTHNGILAAVVTAIAHIIHPWSMPFGLLVTFFLAGTKVTKVKHEIKSKLTIQASGNSGGEGSRTHIQGDLYNSFIYRSLMITLVLANSGVSSILSILHTYLLNRRNESTAKYCQSWPGDLLAIGIIANYAAVAADTFSSELGILSKSQPRLITSLSLRKVPPGTNGAVTPLGLAAGVLGSLIIVIMSIVLTPFCQSPIDTGNNYRVWTFTDKFWFSVAMTLWGALGSVIDSFLGGWLQQSVVDIRSGKIIEGEGGSKVLVRNPEDTKPLCDTQEDITQVNEIENSTKNSVGISSPSPDQYDRGLYAGADDADSYKTEGSSVKFESLKTKPSRFVESGSIALLDNNEVNFIMALTMSTGAMLIASWVSNFSPSTPTS